MAQKMSPFAVTSPDNNNRFLKKTFCWPIYVISVSVQCKSDSYFQNLTNIKVQPLVEAGEMIQRSRELI